MVRFVARAVLVSVATASAAVVTLGACGTDPVGVESCRRIEHARCENAYGCGISLDEPVHRGDTPSLDIAACKRFYDEACLHGMVAPSDPGAIAVDACVTAIHETPDCEIVRAPEKHPDCAFLIPPAPAPEPAPEPAVDAGDVDAGDAATTGS